MKRKFFSVLLALVLVMSFSLVTAVPVAAQTDWYVATTGNDTTGDGSSGNPWATIGYAISQASASDTIIAADGTYTEDLTVNIANLTIRSASGAGSTTIQLQSGVGIEIQAGGDNFVLGGASGEGFTVQSSSGAGTTRNIELVNAPSGVEISYNTIDTTGGASMGISVGAAGATDLTISNNTFTAEDGDGSTWGPTVASANVSNNTFTGPTTPTSGYAIQFSGVTGTSTINANTITNMATGIFVYGADTTVSGLTISGNTISGSAKGIRLGHTSQTNAMTTVTVTQNTLSTNTVGIYISADADVAPAQFTINNNNISGSTTFGLQNAHSTSVTAEDNWWGDASGPTHSSNLLGTGDVVSDSVDFIPWLDAAYPSGQPAGLVTNITQNTGHATIQAAINAASAGDTIVARDGTYTEDLTVNTVNLTLRSLNGKAVTTIQLVDGVGIDIQGGAGGFTLGGASGQGFMISPHATATTFDIQLANAPSGVTISYNTIDTAGTASMGISVGAAGATGLTISNNTFTADSSDGSIFGQDVVNLTVADNVFTGPGGYAIEFVGVTGTSTISGNTITGSYSNGIFIFGASATAQAGTTGVSGLTISGNTVNGSTKGIRLGYSDQSEDIDDVTVENNTLSSNTVGLYVSDGANVLASNFVIRYNSFVGNTNGLQNAHATEQVTAEGNWWNNVAGPEIITNPYDAYNNSPVADSVTTNVDYIPWMIHTSLASGWNVYSTPIAPDASSSTIVDALNVWGVYAWGVDDLALYFDGSDGEWKEATSLTPLQAVYIKMAAAATIDVVFSTNYSETPSQTMYAGWNLIGLAELYDMDAEDALASAYYVAGANNIGYGQVVSPPVGQTAWSAVRGPSIDTLTGETMSSTEGYWLFMVNQGTLAGFTSTPITPLP